MKFLLDTHTLIWFLNGEVQLSSHARRLIEDENNEMLVSIASLWEMAIKYSIGKLELAQPFGALFPRQLEINHIETLGITTEHLKSLCDLPFHHRYPFDRLLIAQAQTENLPIISADKIFDAYVIQREW